MLKNPSGWSDFLTTINQITFILLLLCALAGPAQEYAKGEKPFKIITYSVEVLTSAIAGVIVNLLLRVTDLPEEWIGAFTGIGSFFGVRMMSVLYQLFMGRIKLLLGHKDGNKE